VVVLKESSLHRVYVSVSFADFDFCSLTVDSHWMCCTGRKCSLANWPRDWCSKTVRFCWVWYRGRSWPRSSCYESQHRWSRCEYFA